ncbi:MAG: GH1 family beta-glucosidase [Bacteroidota bacterium]
MSRLTFPPGFLWGTATAAYQIEGSPAADGKGESIWDRFTHLPGRIEDGSTGDVACDHYRRWREDLDLLAELGVNAYRFSIAWPRVFPNGKGRPNRAGLDFYRRLVDGLLARGITPMATLYHWDLPQALEDAGGWPSRETALRFQDYAACLFEQLEGVAYWVTLNEPQVSAFVGYTWGAHAPGRKSWRDGLLAAHNLLLGHGLALAAFRATGSKAARIGITLNLSPVHPASEREADRIAARWHEAVNFRFFLEGVLRGRYPDEAGELAHRLGLLAFPASEMQTIGAPLDFLGINYYTRAVIAADPGSFTGGRHVEPDGPITKMGWEIYPEGLYELLRGISVDYPKLPLYITENGAAFDDRVESDGVIHDTDRLVYLRAHLAQAHRAITDGVDLRGYFIWSLLDNFEWAFGFTKRFGLFYTDYRTQARVWKDSARWYQRVIEEHGV